MRAEDRFEESHELDASIQQVVANLEALSDARIFSVRGVWDLKAKSKHAGTCKRLGGPERVLFGVDYLIIVHRESFERLTEVHQLALLIHEVHHIMKSAKDQEEPSLRAHGHDFCTIPEHDKFSEGLALDIKGRITLPLSKKAATIDEFVQSGVSF